MDSRIEGQIERPDSPVILPGRPDPGARPGGPIRPSPVSVRARRCRFVLLWRPAACKRAGGGVFS